MDKNYLTERYENNLAYKILVTPSDITNLDTIPKRKRKITRGVLIYGWDQIKESRDIPVTQAFLFTTHNNCLDGRVLQKRGPYLITEVSPTKTREGQNAIVLKYRFI